LERYFSKSGRQPIALERTDIILKDSKDQVIFQRDCEFPKTWTHNARVITASKYFTDEESSVQELFGRVIKTISEEGLKQGIFKIHRQQNEAQIFSDELNRILIEQRASFNSPVWFNIGVPSRRQQASACFLLDVQDDMESILDWIKTEGIIFKGGSGSGLNVSKLRGEGEPIHPRGTSSGPLSFMAAADSLSGSIKSGGATRRAAKMVIMDCDHPDILEFIRCKKTAEDLLRKFKAAGDDIDVNSKILSYIPYQNANNSVSVTDAFMNAVINDKLWVLKPRTDVEKMKTLPAKEIFREIAQIAYECADPGLFYYDTINKWHTVKNSGPIITCNPCVTGDTQIMTLDGPKSFKTLAEAGKDVLVHAWHPETKLPVVRWMRNPRRTRQEAELVEVEFDSGLKVRCTPDHSFYSFRGEKVQAGDLKIGSSVRAWSMSQHRDGHLRVHGWDAERNLSNHQWVSRMVFENTNGPIPAGAIVHHEDENKLNNWPTNLGLIKDQSEHNSIHYPKRFTNGFDGTAPNHKVIAVRAAGVEDVYNGTVDDAHTYIIVDPNPVAGIASGIVSANCGEFLHLPYTACNLASINLLKFLSFDNGHLAFDVAGYIQTVKIMITAMEILVSYSDYPIPEIAKATEEYRPLGLGYANLGALLMCLGQPYDSDEGRTTAQAVTSLLTAVAYAESAKMAERVGPFQGYEQNKQCFKEVMEKHIAAYRDLCMTPSPDEPASKVIQKITMAANDYWIKVKEAEVFRNGQISLLAPTGTISFMMDCDTTGIEPDLSLVKHKKLVGGGSLKMTNQNVDFALFVLGYNEENRNKILDFITENNTVENCGFIQQKHVEIFQCAFKGGGRNSIAPSGHLKMVAAVQPFLSGGISKTVNLPEEATVSDIENVYFDAWSMGIKDISIYRDGSKVAQPLKSETKTQTASSIEMPFLRLDPTPTRKRLPNTRNSKTHKFSIGGHEGYVTVGFYPDGTPGEIFVTMNKEGSTISGLMDAFATSISIGLQYGVPLDSLIEKFKFTRFEPSGFTGDEFIPNATSVIDYLFKWLELEFATKQAHTVDDLIFGFDHHINSVSVNGYQLNASDNINYGTTQNNGDSCSRCGGLLIQAGSCKACSSCGDSTGCG
jgi:ribonucleotide reductase alpha subunit